MSIERLEKKVDRLDERLDAIDKHLTVYNEQLLVHIKRTDILEERTKPAIFMTDVSALLLKLVAAGAALAAIVKSVWP